MLKTVSHKKIAFCIAGTFNSGGMERVLANKANFLQDNGFDVTIITTDQDGRPPFYKLNPKIQLVDLNINYFKNIKHGLLKAFPYLFLQFNNYKKLKAMLLESNFDIVVSMFDHEAFLLPFIKDSSIKIAEIHFSRFKRIQYGRKGLLGIIDYGRYKLDKWIASKYSKFIVLTNEDKGYWIGLDNIEVIPNSNSFNSNEMADLKSKSVIAVGRYDYQKRFDHLISAWKFVHEKYPDWQLYIFGQGEDHNKLQNQIKSLKLSDTVFLKSAVKDVKAEYLKCSIMALSSRYEGLPMALLEAQSCGLPLISYACKCGPSDIIIDGINGYLIEDGNILELSNKLVQLIEDENKRFEMGTKSKELAHRFDENVIMSKWLKLFNQI